MRFEVMRHYGLVQPLSQAGYDETDHHKQILKDIRDAVPEGRLIAVCGVVGCGKTLTIRRLQQQLRERSILVRHFPPPRIAEFLRISIGTAEECTALVRALQEVLSHGASTPVPRD
jgi:ABC-type multidrug transport system ATPase subunit